MCIFAFVLTLRGDEGQYRDEAVNAVLYCDLLSNLVFGVAGRGGVVIAQHALRGSLEFLGIEGRKGSKGGI